MRGGLSNIRAVLFSAGTTDGNVLHKKSADHLQPADNNMGTSKNRFEKGKWVECAECDESRRSKAVCLTRRFSEAGGVLYTFSLKQGF